MQLGELGPDLGLVLARDLLAPRLAVGVGLEADHATPAAGIKILVTYIYNRGRKAEREDADTGKLAAQLEELNRRPAPGIDGGSVPPTNQSPRLTHKYLREL